MISSKILFQLSLLLVLSAPLLLTPTNAQTVNPSSNTAPCGNVGNECPLGISPSYVQAVPGNTVTVNVVVNNTMGLGIYRIEVHYDFSMLRAIKVHSLNSSNIWDPQTLAQPTPPPWTSDGCDTGNSYNATGFLLEASHQTTCVPLTVFDANGIRAPSFPECSVASSAFSGCVVESQTLLGGLVNITRTSGLTLFSIDFTILQAGCSTINLSAHDQLLAGVEIAGPFIGGLSPDQEKRYFAFPADGQICGIGSAALIKSKVDVAVHHLKLSQGNAQTLSATIGNTGTVPVNVRADFVIVSEAGDVFFVSTGVLLLPVNTNGILSVSYTVPSLPLRYHVIGILTLSADGVHFVRSGSTATTAYSVVL